MSLSSGHIPTIDNILRATGGNIQKIHELVNVPEFLKVAAAMTARRYHDAVQASANPNPPTIAAQAFGNPPGVPVGAASAPQMGAGGLGATPQAGGDMMAAPQPAEGMPQEPMAMAEGGLMNLPVDDSMFDEPDNGGFDDSYAGGGVVAFAAGASVGPMSRYYNPVLQQESGGNPTARSPKGAYGLMQLMPGTMRDPGYGLAPLRDNSPKANLEHGRRYLDAMYREFGDEKLALMAYNWGPGNVKKWLNSGADPKKVPAETRKYLASVGKMAGKEIAAPAKEAGNTFYGVPISDPRATIEYVKELMPEESEERKAYREDIRKRMSPEEQKKERKRAAWASLIPLGVGIGTTPGNLLAGITAGLGQAAPELVRSLAEQRKEQRDLLKETVALENLGNEEKRALVKAGLDLYGAGVKGTEEREAAAKSQQTQRDVANIYANAKSDSEGAPVGLTPKGRIALTKDIQKISKAVDQQFAPQLDMARSANNPTQLKMLENQKLAAQQRQEDEIYAAYGMEPPKRKPVNVPINGRTYTFPNMYSALEAIRQYNASQR